VSLLWQRLEHYLLISISLAFLTGILFQHLCFITPGSSAILSAFLFFPLLFSFKQNVSGYVFVSLLLLVFSLGMFHAANYSTRPFGEGTIYNNITEETDVVVSGTLHAMPLFDGQKTSILLKTRLLQKKSEESFSLTSGLVKLSLRNVWPKRYKPGDELVIRCKLSRPYRFQNPGGFDYPAFLAAKNIFITGKISTTAHIHSLNHTQSWLQTLRYLSENKRVQIRDFMNASLSEDHAAIYRALLIGDRSGINKDLLETFKASGVMHILAISGLHVSLVASALFILFYWLTRRSTFLLLRYSCKKIALLATIPPLCIYALLAGAQTPVLRSLIMVLVFILAFCVQRHRSPFTTLSFAALLILVLNPLTLFTASFQLSFAAVASLILILPHLISIVQIAPTEDETNITLICKKVLHWIYAALLVSIAATIGTAPLLLYTFNRISTFGPFANLLLEPLLCLWSLPFGLLSIIFLGIAPSFAGILLHIGDTGIFAAISITDLLASFPYSTLWFATPSVPLIICYYVSLAFCFSRFPLQTRIPLFLAICLLFYFPPRRYIKKLDTTAELVFLDVGQGNATFIRFGDGKKILVDGGGAYSKKFNVGESVIAPYLWHEGFTHLDAILITHPDADHYNGIPFLLQRFRPDILWINGDSGHDQRYENLLSLAKELNIRIQTVKGEQLLLTGKDAELRSVPNLLQDNGSASSNDQSVIVRFSDSVFSCLLTGDISKNVEQILLQNKERLQSDILLAAHHGSKTSNSRVFLNTVKPKQIIVSSGRFHPEFFPSKQLRSFCENEQIPLLITAEHGAISVKNSGEKFDISHPR